MASRDDWRRLDWFRKPTDGAYADGTLNACYNALDRHVIRGAADELVDGTSRARLLSEAAAFAGALAVLGVSVGDRVAVLGAPEVAVLGVLRLGAVVSDSGAVAVSADGIAVPEQDEVPWDVALRAGRTDPAGCAAVAGDSAVAVLDGRPFPLAATLLALMDGGGPEALVPLARLL